MPFEKRKRKKECSTRRIDLSSRSFIVFLLQQWASIMCQNVDILMQNTEERKKAERKSVGKLSQTTSLMRFYEDAGKRNTESNRIRCWLKKEKENPPLPTFYTG